jgi:hypothetical protein
MGDQQQNDENNGMNKRRKFKKMHNRSRDFIDNYLELAKVPVQAAAL